MSTIPFDEIAAGTSVRTCIIENDQYLSVRDIIMHICSLTTVQATQKWRLFSDEVKNEVAQFLRNFQFPGKGNKSEPVITFKGALKLVMMVSGDKAALCRSAMVKILTRYYAGDDSLTDEIEANAQSSAPIAQLARASLETSALALTHKRKMEDLEIARLEVQIEAQRIANRDAAREHLSKVACSIRELSEDTVLDERTRLILKDNFLNMVMFQSSSQSLLTNHPVEQQTNNRPISLSMVAVAMGLKLSSSDLISVGIELKKRYTQKHGKEPSKHDQLCSGRMTKVNSYTENDRDLMEETLRCFAAGKKGER